MRDEDKPQCLDMIPRVFVRALRDPHGNEEFELSEGEATDLLRRREAIAVHKELRMAHAAIQQRWATTSNERTSDAATSYMQNGIGPGMAAALKVIDEMIAQSARGLSRAPSEDQTDTGEPDAHMP